MLQNIRQFFFHEKSNLGQIGRLPGLWKCEKKLSALGAKALTIVMPLDPAGALPTDPRYELALRAHYVASPPQKKNSDPGSASAL